MTHDAILNFLDRGTDCCSWSPCATHYTHMYTSKHMTETHSAQSAERRTQNAGMNDTARSSGDQRQDDRFRRCQTATTSDEAQTHDDDNHTHTHLHLRHSTHKHNNSNTQSRYIISRVAHITHHTHRTHTWHTTRPQHSLCHQKQRVPARSRNVHHAKWSTAAVGRNGVAHAHTQGEGQWR